jgi:tellurite methyltransferase
MRNDHDKPGPNASRGGCGAPDVDWPAYFDAMTGKPPRETLVFALDAFDREAQGQPKPPGPPLAIDLGCGQGRDTYEILRRGWRVLAVDAHPEAIKRIVDGAPEADRPRLTTRVTKMEDIDWPPADLVNASFTLPFCLPADFPGVWAKIAASLRPGGRFCGQLFGDRDEWAKYPDRTHQSRAEALALLEGFDVERFEEEERAGKDGLGKPKYWHVFHLVARKR